MPDQLPTAPQNFDHVERYVSNLPLKRVKDLHKVADEHINLFENMRIGSKVLTFEELFYKSEMLANYMFELTQSNNQ